MENINKDKSPPPEELSLKMSDISALNCEGFKNENSITNTFYFGLDSIIPNMKETGLKCFEAKRKTERIDIDDFIEQFRSMSEFVDSNCGEITGDFMNLVLEFNRFGNFLSKCIERKFFKGKTSCLQELEKSITILRWLKRRKTK